MTLQEKVSLVGGDGVNNNGVLPGGHTGATFAVPRLGLPSVKFSDGPVGVRQGEGTAMPVPIALAATMTPSLAYTYGRTIASEAKAKGNDVVYGPAVNLMRTPQSGRTYENFGEETLLAARTGVPWIRGAQSTGVIADIKHFAANNQEGQLGIPPFAAADGGRQVVNVRVSERVLREVYMPHFEAAVKQGHVGTLMCSYNLVNGRKACENRHLLTTVLRRNWGFKGIILSDYGATLPSSTVPALNNGLDFVPAQGGLDQAYSPAQVDVALTSGQVKAQVLDDHVHRILRTLFAYGYFDRNPYVDDDAQIDKTGHSRVSQRVEERAITLLKNNGVLPLGPDVKKIAVIGPYADRFVTGGGSGAVKPFAGQVVTALQGITARAGTGVKVSYADGSNQTAAAALAKAADVAIVVVGDVMTEGQDKDCIALNCPSDTLNSLAVLISRGLTLCAVQEPCPLNGTDQDGLITAVAAAQPKTVALLQTGGPVLTPWRAKVAAVVEAWYPGQRGGSAIARVLFGDIDPSGRLPVTFPASAGQLPTAGSRARYPGVANRETYSEGLLAGYRWYDAKHHTPAYEFGAGLSYTRFRYGHLKVRRGGVNGAVATATLSVTNTGKRAGYAVPQLYLSKPRTTRLTQPVRQLVSYRSTKIAAGRTVRVSFPLNDRSFASWDPAVRTAGGWRNLPGCYKLAVGSSSRHLTSTTIVARGAGCRRAALRLGTRGTFGLPLPPDASTRPVPAP